MARIDTRAALRTRYHGPTNYKCSRISAYRDGWGGCKSQRCYVSWDYAINPEQNHAAAAQAFCNKFLNNGARISSPGLCFDGDYFWTWHATEQKNIPKDYSMPGQILVRSEA